MPQAPACFKKHQVTFFRISQRDPPPHSHLLPCRSRQYLVKHIIITHLDKRRAVNATPALSAQAIRCPLPAFVHPVKCRGRRCNHYRYYMHLRAIQRFGLSRISGLPIQHRIRATTRENDQRQNNNQKFRINIHSAMLLDTAEI